MFSDLYDEVIADRNLAGMMINLAGNMLVLTRRELNRIMDEAKDAGQEGFAAREFEYNYHLADMVTPGERRVFMEALSCRPGAREGYILDSNIAWREEEADLRTTFTVGFDGGETEAEELRTALDRAMKPVMGGRGYRIETSGDGALQTARSLADPVYVRDDLKGELDEINAARPREFEGWDEAAMAFYINLNSAKDMKVVEAFEDRLCGAGFHVPLDGNGQPWCVQDPRLGALMPVFSTRREMLKMFKPGAKSAFWSFLAVALALARYGQLNGLCVNMCGIHLTVTRRRLGAIIARNGGQPGDRVGPRRTRIAKKQNGLAKPIHIFEKRNQLNF
jgi:hypothetical protein